MIVPPTGTLTLVKAKKVNNTEVIPPEIRLTGVTFAGCNAPTVCFAFERLMLMDTVETVAFAAPSDSDMVVWRLPSPVQCLLPSYFTTQHSCSFRPTRQDSADLAVVQQHPPRNPYLCSLGGPPAISGEVTPGVRRVSGVPPGVQCASQRNPRRQDCDR